MPGAGAMLHEIFQKLFITDGLVGKVFQRNTAKSWHDVRQMLAPTVRNLFQVREVIHHLSSVLERVPSVDIAIQVIEWIVAITNGHSPPIKEVQRKGCCPRRRQHSGIVGIELCCIVEGTLLSPSDGTSAGPVTCKAEGAIAISAVVSDHVGDGLRSFLTRDVWQTNTKGHVGGDIRLKEGKLHAEVRVIGSLGLFLFGDFGALQMDLGLQQMAGRRSLI
mmetsp:Transcript_7861/g.13658  ORF Transcript_7861/g.13658 Transcript_7861/m.13658 type:complete len:220 (-) Transcript_7861:81-740(-)